MSDRRVQLGALCGMQYSCYKSKKIKMATTEKPKKPKKRCTCPFKVIMKKWRQNPMEALFVTYNQHQKERAVPWLLLTGLLFNLYIALTPSSLSSYYCAATGAMVNVLFGLMYRFFPALRSSLPLFVYFDLWIQFFINAFLRLGDSYNEFLGWAVLYLYLSITSVPLHIALQIMLDLGIVGTYIVMQYFNALIIYGSTPLPYDFLIQQLANFCVLFGTMILGLKGYVVWHKLQRSSFRETKKSLRNSLAIERESKEQERLLLSVLPEHVAVQMRKDLGLIDTQFKKIYMSRHENVSILYADIVGFTAISSTYSAQDLVAILNELFARFDRLAEKYNQLRIKILGDCYYCISGAPVERSDHAVLCVHMGLSMVKAIKYVQQTTNSPVDMRVGIHTGAVLAGVLGQRQWQFDVYSRDVELANKMESSGMAGRVHISEATLGFLNDEFEVEPAYGERRDEMLRHAGIKTYFIVKVLKPYQGHEAVKEGEAEKTNEGAEVETPNDLKDEDGESGIFVLRKEGKRWVSLATPDSSMVVIPPKDEKMKEVMDAKILKMLRQELLSRDDDKELADATTFSLTFKDADIEKKYIRRPNPCPLMIALIPLILVPSYAIIAWFATPSSWPLHAIYIALVLEIGCFNITYFACIRRAAKDRKNDNSFGRVLCGLFNIGMFIVANALPLAFCGMYETAINDGLRFDAQAHKNMSRCEHPSYYYHIAIIIACGVLWVPVGLTTRALLLVGLAFFHIMPAIIYSPLLSIRPDLDRDPFVITNLTKPYEEELFDIMRTMHEYRNITMLVLIIISLIIFNRYSESLERARFSRGLRMCAQAEQASDLRRRNQALVHNVLPPHVARYFLGARHHHRDLYSQSYAEVGVLFASMPNFSEFYSEETVNNQGLECLRFLNEVISDFDMLLEDKRFAKDIIKIKTIGSTYMAASGLNPTRDMQPSDGVQVRWAHLSCLVEFALELQRTLTAINEQSFNHFVLRLGVNHGPITAGVIGARKPHYDIWGNTVNVASRMESTGKAGCIQVTEETCQILQTFGYYFEQRGLVAVKGKGQLMTYYLQGKRTPPTTPIIRHDDMEAIEAAQDVDALLTNHDTSIVVSPPSIPEEQLSDDAQSALI